MDENIREEILQENKMGTMPVGRLLFSMAVPMMVSMLFQALYNVVDSIFVAKLSQDAMNAVSLAFPLQTLCIAFSGGTGVGMNALLSRSLGEKNQAGADRAANVGLFLTLCNLQVKLLFCRQKQIKLSAIIKKLTAIALVEIANQQIVHCTKMCNVIILRNIVFNDICHVVSCCNFNRGRKSLYLLIIKPHILQVFKNLIFTDCLTKNCLKMRCILFFCGKHNLAVTN